MSKEIIRRRFFKALNKIEVEKSHKNYAAKIIDFLNEIAAAACSGKMILGLEGGRRYSDLKGFT